jgi:hypothetical protein
MKIFAKLEPKAFSDDGPKERSAVARLSKKTGA